ncbi:ECF transporter S component, partial [bacterium]|nr:ECF transporter S component [bacterium]
MPPAISLFPITIELITYGAVVGLMFHTLKKSILSSLFSAMIAGRIASILLVSIILGRVGMAHQFYSLFVLAIPGLIIQIALIPPLVVKISHFLQDQES